MGLLLVLKGVKEHMRESCVKELREMLMLGIRGDMRRLSVEEGLIEYERYLNRNMGMGKEILKEMGYEVYKEVKRSKRVEIERRMINASRKRYRSESLKKKEIKKCEEGKELNEKTKRCIKKCKENEIRNEKTRRCIKKK